MITMYKRGPVYWAQSNFDGFQRRWSLRTRDRSIAAVLVRREEMAYLTKTAPLGVEAPFIPQPMRQKRRCSNHADVPSYHEGFCRECYYSDKREGEKLTEDEILVFRQDLQLRRLAKYGLRLADYRALLEKQNHRCVICFHPLGEDIFVDHDHRTRDVRGLLHGICNVALGAFESKGREWTESALKYLGWRY